MARGAIWQARGFARPAVDHFLRARDIAQQAASRSLVAASYGALAAAYGDLGQWDRVLDYAERQHEAEERRTPATEFRYFFQRGVAFAEFHDGEQAERDQQQALKIAREAGDSRGISMALGELAALAIDVHNDASRALRTYNEALEIARQSRLRDLEATWLLDLGAAFMEAGDFAAARQRFEQAIAVERASGARRLTPAAHKNLAKVLLHDDQRPGAEAMLRTAQREADEQNLPQLGWEVRIERAVLAAGVDPASAERLFDEALDILEDAQGSVLVEQLRTGALSRALRAADPYDLAIDFLLDRGAIEKAFLVAERGRARAFLETLRMAADEVARALPPAYVEAEASLLADISEGQAALRLERPTAEERRALKDAINADEAQLNMLRLRLASDRPAVAAARYPQLWRAEDLRARVLRPNQALVMFFLGSNESTSWIVDPRGVRVVRLQSEAAISRVVREYLQSTRRPRDNAEPALASKVFQLLLPGFSISPGISDLVVVPHGILHDLPFEALRDSSGARLVERFEIEYAPSASSFALLATRDPVSRRASTVLAVGNPVMSGRADATTREVGIEHLSLLKPLPFSGVELNEIAKLFGPAARVLKGAEATEPALRAADLSSASILHFATHGVIDEERPERSGLVLTARPPADDGLLQMREIYGLRLQRALVTLSACETALGANVRGEGMVGLSRAFFYAGADAVVASVWSVSDRSTAAFMTEFYRGLGEGLSAAAALRRAKLRFLRESADFADAYFWAPFIVIGNGSWNGAPPVVPPAGGPRIVSIVFAIVAAAAAWLAWRRSRARRSKSPVSFA